MKPVIGLTCAIGNGEASGPASDAEPYEYLYRRYISWVLDAGGAPVVLPNLGDYVALETLLDLLQGLVLTGGVDPAAQWIGEEPHPTITVQPERDDAEIYLLRRARERRLPVLGVCRGMQMMAVAFGGDIWQDQSLRAERYPTKNHRSHADGRPRLHDVEVDPSSHLARFAGRERYRANSSHHQLIRTLPPGFSACAKTLDGVVEAMERVNRGDYLVGVQWHPERSPDHPLSRALIDDFIQAARRCPAGGRGSGK